jgi:anti-sigma regulatory factor (Ser/Thr protein kinase)
VDATFSVRARVDGGDVVIEVGDRGTWREARGEHRGRGLTLMRGLMDAVDVDREPDGTTVRLRRTLQRRAAA